MSYRIAADFIFTAISFANILSLYNPELLNLYSTGNGPADSHRIIFVMTPFTTVSFERNDVAPFVSNKAELC